MAKGQDTMLSDKHLNEEISIFERLRRETTMDTTTMDVICAGEEVNTQQEQVIESCSLVLFCYTFVSDTNLSVCSRSKPA